MDITFDGIIFVLMKNDTLIRAFNLGFGLIDLYQAVAKQGAKNLTCVSNSTRGGATLPADAPDMGQMIKNEQVKKVICAFTAPTRASQRLILSEYVERGLIEAELVPLRNSVLLPYVNTVFDASGNPVDPITDAALAIALDDLAWWARLLARARTDQLSPARARMQVAVEAVGSA